ncbi:ankyrin repeat domain-containing protein [Massilia sp. TS11]|uniref:ankyrin repeat domain-containing protein n=1 Tax=Massilia sp. TS11 TaxID=2908003 RepID=UPI001EDC72F7|nr:ankyrin repeat domain-containing protein [Massilia sp. TS11]MCG2584713.1 ankyrin repeat domain-containing protein [Massilia sp. TS11]
MRILKWIPLLASLIMPVARADDAVEFFRAVQIDNVSGVRSLLAAGLDPNIAEPLRGETGLILALREEAPRVFEVLLADPRIRVEAQARNGNTALMMAAFKKNLPAVQALLAKGAAVNRPGWTPLHYAAAAGADDIVSLLLARGAQLEAPAEAGLTPLMMAAREGHESTTLLLLSKGADPARVNSEGKDSAQQAEQYGRGHVVTAIQQFRAHSKK